MYQMNISGNTFSIYLLTSTADKKTMGRLDTVTDHKWPIIKGLKFQLSNNFALAIRRWIYKTTAGNFQTESLQGI